MIRKETEERPEENPDNDELPAEWVRAFFARLTSRAVERIKFENLMNSNGIDQVPQTSYLANSPALTDDRF